MKYQVLTFALFQLSSLCKSQKLIIDSASLKKGIYRTFEEFRSNAPSVTPLFSLEQHPVYIAGFNNDLHISYSLLFSTNMGETPIDSVWGVCDGENVYVANNSGKFKKDMGYQKLYFLGRYCLYDKEYKCGAAMYDMGDCLETYVLNINNGGTRELNLFTAKEILKRDKELYQSFMLGTGKKKKANKFIIKYSLKHPEEVKRN